jgi:predicted nucleotidyltransferase
MELDMSRDVHEHSTPIDILLRERREEILRIAHQHGARNVRLFGSVARGESTADSDIDLLVDAGQKTSPWFPAGLIDELERLLGRRVDVVTEDSLYWLLRRRILKEAKSL